MSCFPSESEVFSEIFHHSIRIPEINQSLPELQPIANNFLNYSTVFRQRMQTVASNYTGPLAVMVIYTSYPLSQGY